MKQNISCISIYLNAQDSRQAINRLQAAHWDLKNLSIVAEHKCCEQLDELFDDISLLEIPEFGLLTISAKLLPPIISDDKKGAQSSDLTQQKNLLEQIFFNIGVPTGQLHEYAQAVKDNQILLLVNGAQQEVERACDILHNETQQVTVHRV